MLMLLQGDGVVCGVFVGGPGVAGCRIGSLRCPID